MEKINIEELTPVEKHMINLVFIMFAEEKQDLRIS